VELEDQPDQWVDLAEEGALHVAASTLAHLTEVQSCYRPRHHKYKY
jgi:hypothetical protein